MNQRVTIPELTFQARVWDKEKLFKAAQRLAMQKGYRFGGWREGMRIVLCPMAYLDFGWVRESQIFGFWRVTGGCISAPGGAGAHKAALEFLELLAKRDLKKLELRDDTGYLQDRDFQRLRRECFDPWLEGVIADALERLEAHPEEEVSLFWTPDQCQPEPLPGALTTPMGRFSPRWLRKTLEEGGVRALGERFFLWDNPEPDARFHRNCALKRLWEDCAFAPTDRSQEDAQWNRFVLDSLERAARLDPSLPLPVEAYGEVCVLDDRAYSLPEDAPALEEDYQPGYRKGELLCPFGTLRLPLPGVYRYEWFQEYQESGGVWRDEESDSPIWRVSGYRVARGQAEFNLDTKVLRDVTDLELEGGRARWGWAPLEGKRRDPDQLLYQLACEVAAGPMLYHIAVLYREPEEREGIEARFRRLQIIPE